MQTHKLQLDNRTVTGRKVKKLRRDGLLPANIFGKDVKSVSVQVIAKDFARVYREAGETGIVELTLSSEKKVRPVLIRNVQRHPVSGFHLHADFHQVDLSVKVRATVPLVTSGEAPAVVQKIGALFSPVDEVEVEALPMDLPEEISVDVTALGELDQEIKVKDLKIDTTKITILTDPELVIAKIGPIVSKEAEELAKEQAAAAAAATTTESVPGTEGEQAPAAAEAPAEKPPASKETATAEAKKA